MQTIVNICESPSNYPRSVKPKTGWTKISKYVEPLEKYFPKCTLPKYPFEFFIIFWDSFDFFELPVCGKGLLKYRGCIIP